MAPKLAITQIQSLNFPWIAEDFKNVDGVNFEALKRRNVWLGIILDS